MSAELTALLLAGFAGMAMPIGGLLARIEHFGDARLHNGILSSVTALGGGALLSAVALVLVPRGAEVLPPGVAIVLLCAGGIVFYLIDRRLSGAGGSGSMMLAMLLDFLPEAMALGALIVADTATAKLLALMIFVQNLPEGFTAFREIWRNGTSAGSLLLIFFALAGLGPVCALIGLTVLSSQPEFLGGIMIFSAGGILYLIFQDIAPAARSGQSSAPALGAVVGFGIGLAGSVLIGG